MSLPKYTSVSFGREQLTPILPGLLEKYPGLSVEVDFDDRVIDLIQDRYRLYDQRQRGV